MNRRVQKQQRSQSQPKIKSEKIIREVGPRKEEIIQIIRKKNEYLDNFSYHETKEIKRNNPRYFAFVEHIRKGDIFGGNLEKTNYERQTYSQGGNRPKLNDGNLRGKKQVPKNNGSIEITKKTTTRTTTTNTRERKPNQVSATATREKIQETTMKRRNEGTVSKTETRTKTKTTTSGIRGGERKTQQTTSTITRTRGGDKEGSSTRKRSGKK